MFSAENYLTGWGVYIASSIGLLVVWWFMIRWIKYAMVRHMLMLASAAALLFPYSIDEQTDTLAPGIMMTFAEGLFIKDAGFARAGIPTLIAVMVVLILYLAIDLGWQQFRNKRNARLQKESEQLQDHDELIQQNSQSH